MKNRGGMAGSSCGISLVLALMIAAVPEFLWSQQQVADRQTQEAMHATGRWSVQAKAGWLELNGTRRLVRGDRKIVATDAAGGFSPHLEIEYRLTPRYSISLGFFSLKTKYGHDEDFTNGQAISTSDDLDLWVLSAGLRRNLLSGRQLNLYVGAHIAYVAFSNRIHLLSEQIIPADLSTINPSPFNLKVYDGPGFGLMTGGELPIGGRGWFIASRVSLTLAFMRADIINDPEDPEDGTDINSPMHPFRLDFGIGYRF